MNKERICIKCETVFTVRAPSVPNKYCSRECSKLVNLGRIPSEYTRNKMSASHKGRTAWNKGVPNSVETRKKISEANKGRVFSDLHKQKIGEANSNRIWTVEMKEKQSGSNCNFWKGGIASIQNQLRHTVEYKEWRKCVYERDGYKCRDCGISKDLHAHHIKSFAKYPDLRYTVANGKTVCRDCHSIIHGRIIPNIAKVNKRTPCGV